MPALCVVRKTQLKEMVSAQRNFLVLFMKHIWLFFFHFMNDLSASFSSTAECQKQTASSMPVKLNSIDNDIDDDYDNSNNNDIDWHNSRF